MRYVFLVVLLFVCTMIISGNRIQPQPSAVIALKGLNNSLDKLQYEIFNNRDSVAFISELRNIQKNK